VGKKGPRSARTVRTSRRGPATSYAARPLEVEAAESHLTALRKVPGGLGSLECHTLSVSFTFSATGGARPLKLVKIAYVSLGYLAKLGQGGAAVRNGSAKDPSAQGVRFADREPFTDAFTADPTLESHS